MQKDLGICIPRMRRRRRRRSRRLTNDNLTLRSMDMKSRMRHFELMLKGQRVMEKEEVSYCLPYHRLPLLLIFPFHYSSFPFTFIIFHHCLRHYAVPSIILPLTFIHPPLPLLPLHLLSSSYRRNGKSVQTQKGRWRSFEVQWREWSKRWLASVHPPSPLPSLSLSPVNFSPLPL